MDLLVDIRTVPRSRRVPQFNRESIEAELAAAGYPVEYVHLPRLGGLRRGLPESRSPNRAWRTPGFRGFADYMLTAEFEAGLQELLDLARGRRPAIMCAEAVPWRCHRSLVSDALTVRGVRVCHIRSRTRCELHQLPLFARVEGMVVTYPGEAPR